MQIRAIAGVTLTAATLTLTPFALTPSAEAPGAVRLAFQATVGAAPFACGKTFADIGTTKSAITVCGNLPADRPPAFTEVLAVLDRKPEVRNLNRMKQRNAAALVHRAADAQRTYGTSQALLKRAEKVIPLGSQTFSKSRTQYPVGAAPHFAVRSAGSRHGGASGADSVPMGRILTLHLCVMCVWFE